jgi:hypothetical protein
MNLSSFNVTSIQTDLMQAPSAPIGQQKQLSVPHTSGVEAVGDELYDAECLKLINEYFYGNFQRGF